MSVSRFDFHDYVSKKSDEDLKKFAQISGTTIRYIKEHLISKKKVPRLSMIESLVRAANGEFTKTQFIHWLYDLDAA